MNGGFPPINQNKIKKKTKNNIKKKNKKKVRFVSNKFDNVEISDILLFIKNNKNNKNNIIKELKEIETVTSI